MLFFERVQCFLPLLHRPNFNAEFFDPNIPALQRYENLNYEMAFLLNGIFSLSSRFSNDGPLWGSEPRKRGCQFADRSRAIFDHLMRSEWKPTLRFLQGFILLTYYDLTSKPSFQAWLSTGMCYRIAYSLSLHQIDRYHTAEGTPSKECWSMKEEKRRAWWAVYQMDNFASIISGRPFNIDSNCVDVFLPVSDSAWFENSYTPSAPLSKWRMLWRSLVDCENKDPYAWFLVCNGLIRAAHNQFHKQNFSVSDIEILRSNLHCFGLSLPPIFHNLHGSFIVRDQSLVDKNWVICTLILLQR